MLGFVDADWSRIIEPKVHPHVVVTDYQDCEGYFFHNGCLERFCARAMAKGDGYGNGIERQVVEACRVLGILRVASERNELQLPIGEHLTAVRRRRQPWRLGHFGACVRSGARLCGGPSTPTAA